MNAMPPSTSAAEQRALDGALVRGMGAVALFVAVAGAARVGQDAAIAWRFGTDATVDAYYFLMSLAGWPVAVALSMLSLLVAPTDASLRRSDPVAARNFRRELLGAVLLVALLSLPVAWAGLHLVIASDLAGGVGIQAASRASAGIPGLVAVVPLGLVGALLSAWLMAAGRHVLALLEGLPALVLLVVVLVIPAPDLFWGTSVGFAIQVLAMACILRRSGELDRPRLARSSHHWQGFSSGALLLLAAQALFALVPLIDAFFAARLGPGTVAALSYSNRLVLGLQGLSGLALQRSGLPLLSKLGAHSALATRRAALRWAVAMGALGVVGGLLVALLADPLVGMLFERGSFTAADRGQCASLLRYGMLQMPFFLGGMALVTALASVSARRALAAIAVVNVCVKLLASLALVPWLGAPGLMVATGVMYAAAAATAWLSLRGHLDPADA
jgi:putative peptidoglycan lipid II flippase